MASIANYQNIRLQIWTEITAILLDVVSSGETTKLIFSGGRIVALPVDFVSNNECKKYIGKKISILRTDIAHKPYVFSAGGKTAKPTVDTVQTSREERARE